MTENMRIMCQVLVFTPAPRTNRWKPPPVDGACAGAPEADLSFPVNFEFLVQRSPRVQDIALSTNPGAELTDVVVHTWNASTLRHERADHKSRSFLTVHHTGGQPGLHETPSQRNNYFKVEKMMCVSVCLCVYVCVAWRTCLCCVSVVCCAWCTHPYTLIRRSKQDIGYPSLSLFTLLPPHRCLPKP